MIKQIWFLVLVTNMSVIFCLFAKIPQNFMVYILDIFRYRFNKNKIMVLTHCKIYKNKKTGQFLTRFFLIIVSNSLQVGF